MKQCVTFMAGFYKEGYSNCTPDFIYFKEIPNGNALFSSYLGFFLVVEGDIDFAMFPNNNIIILNDPIQYLRDNTNLEEVETGKFLLSAEYTDSGNVYEAQYLII